MGSVYRKLLAILEPGERRRFYVLMLVLILVGVAELVGLSSIMVLLRVLTASEEMLLDGGIAARVHAVFGFRDLETFQIVMAAGVIAVFFGSLAVRAAGTYAIVRFSAMRGFTISSRLLLTYLQRPYAWFIQRNTAQLRKLVLSEVNQLVSRVLIPGLRLLSNLIVTGFILGFLLVLNPVVSLAALVFLGGSYGLIYLRLRHPLHRLGEELLEANGERFRLAEEATGGFKAVKLKGAEELFARRFREPARRIARLSALIQLCLALPRFALEGLSVAGMLVLVFVLFAQHAGRLEELVPMLGAFGFATMRLIPAMQQVFQGFASIRNAAVLVDNVHRDLVEGAAPQASAAPEAEPKMALTEEIRLSGVSYSYDQSGRPTLREVDLVIPANSTTGFVGGTGAGKTTLVDLVLGLLTPDRGEVLIDGVALSDGNRRAWQRHIGYVPQSIYLTDDTIASNIAFGVPPDRIDMRAVERAARMAALHDFVVTELPRGYDTAVGERGVRLSGGQRQRIGIARALYSDPDLIVMDEATSALDTLTEEAVMDAVRNMQGRKTVLLIAHRLATVRRCDRIHMLENGEVVASGTYDDLVDASDTFRRMAMGG